VRDYVHVLDLADAHVLALRYLMAGGPAGSFNLGTGNGTTVRELIEGVKRATGKPLPVQMAARRPGDAPILVGDNAKARAELGWAPSRDLDVILSGAWRWHQARADVVIVDPTPRAIAHFEALRQRLGERSETPYAKGGLQPVLSYDLSSIQPDQLIIIPKAIWKDDETVRFYAPKNPHHVSHSIGEEATSDRPFIEVGAITYATLANEQKHPYSILKMDIEGAEIAVLENILDTATDLPRQILVEFDVLQNPSNASRNAVEKMDDRLRAHGYSCLHYDGQRNYIYARAAIVS
jgi:FkbM family methyltransferase